MSEDAIVAFEERVKQRRLVFVAKTLNGWAEIQNWSDRFQANATDAEALAALTRFFHKLAGAAGIYEMTDVCDLAVEAETYCLKNDADQDKPAGIARYLARTRDAFRRFD